MRANLPAPSVIGDQGLDQQAVQQNFEALEIRLRNISSQGQIGLPSGLIFPFGGSSAPDGYLLCNGASVTTALYPDLFAVIGYTYGGSGSSFIVPDLRGRVIAGPDNMGSGAAGRMADNNTLAAASGASSVTLSTNQIPSHTHPFTGTAATISGTTGNAGSHSHQVTVTFGQAADTSQGGSGNRSSLPTASSSSRTYTSDTFAAHSHTFSASYTPAGTVGAQSTTGAAVDNRQPYLILNYVIKT